MRAPPVPSFRRRWTPFLGSAWRRVKQQRKPIPTLFVPLSRLLSLVYSIGIKHPPKGARLKPAPLSIHLRARRKDAKKPKHANKVLAHLRMLRLFAQARTLHAGPYDDGGLAAFEEALETRPEAQAFVADRDAAVRLYRALCNQAWAGPDGRILTVSWRSAGDIVANARKKGEDYLSFYCSGGEGEIAADVQALLETLGWSPTQPEPQRRRGRRPPLPGR